MVIAVNLHLEKTIPRSTHTVEGSLDHFRDKNQILDTVHMAFATNPVSRAPVEWHDKRMLQLKGRRQSLERAALHVWYWFS